MKQHEILAGSGARRPSDYVSARTAVTASEQITVPEGADIVILSGDLPFYAAFGANPAATVAADTDDGTASELVAPDTPVESRSFIVTGTAKIAVAADSAAKVTASFYKL